MANRHTNLDPNHRPHGPGAILRWGITDRLLGRRKRQPPGPPAPIVPPDVDLIHSGTTDPWLTWLGHASFLGSLGGRRFLIDPLFSPHAGWLYRRSLPAPMAIDELPDVDAVMVTHNHYDHLDAGVYSRLGDKVTVVAPCGMNRWLRGRGCTRVIELGWWQQADVGDLRVTLVPARHWSRRGVFDTNRALWGGYVIECAGYSVYHSGDTAHSRALQRSADASRHSRRQCSRSAATNRHGSWSITTSTRSKPVDAFLELGARHLVPMHWGTLQLTDEPLCEPDRPHAFVVAAEWPRQSSSVGRPRRRCFTAYWTAPMTDGKLIFDDAVATRLSPLSGDRRRHQGDLVAREPFPGTWASRRHCSGSPTTSDRPSAPSRLVLFSSAILVASAGFVTTRSPLVGLILLVAAFFPRCGISRLVAVAREALPPRGRDPHRQRHRQARRGGSAHDPDADGPPRQQVTEPQLSLPHGPHDQSRSPAPSSWLRWH